jgi:outer membrane protein OmpA-like peptidoglycan-associated protein
VKKSTLLQLALMLLGLMLSVAVLGQSDSIAPAAASQDQSSAPDRNSPPPDQNTPPSDQNAAPQNNNDQVTVFRVNVFARTTKAVNYRHRGGSTTVDFRGTDLMPEVGGHADVNGKEGRLAISAELTHLRPARGYGGQYLTYVLWAITPEGRAVNLGEVLPGENGKSKISVTTDLQAFGLIVTAEPYYAVTHPSNEVIAENIIRQETKGFEEQIDTKFDVLEGSQYIIDVPADQLPATQADSRVPLDLLEARNAVAIAKAAGAEQYAASSLAKAIEMLDRAEDYLQRKQGRTPIGTAARGATQMAEDARVLTLRRKEQERLEAERRARQEAQEKAEADAREAQARAAQAQAQSEEDARKRADAERAQAEAERARTEAQANQAASLAAQQQAQAEADAARLAAEDSERQKEEAQRATEAAEQARAEAVRQKEEMRARLLAQLNQVLQTRDTVRGLVVNMPDVLFDFNKYTLKPAARERLARMSGIVLAYPDLKLEIEGHTDSIGSDEYNQQLSEKRAATVRDYLVTSGVAVDNVVARGLGKSDPVADNKSAAGRKLNRRVEMIVSGDVIGNRIGGGSAPETTPPNPPTENPQ